MFATVPLPLPPKPNQDAKLEDAKVESSKEEELKLCKSKHGTSTCDDEDGMD